MAPHHDARAETRVVGIEARKLAAGLGRDELRRDRAAVSAELALDSPPVEGFDHNRPLLEAVIASVSEAIQR